MNSRMSFASLFVLALVVGACASGGGGGAAAVSAEPIDTENLPAWVLALPEGTPPVDNPENTEAEIQLFQARSTGDSVRKVTFYQAALTAATAGIAAAPTNPQSYLQAGEAHLGLGNLEAAGEAFDRAEEIYPRYAVNTQFLREERWIEEYNLGVELLVTDPAAAPASDADLAAAQTHFERAHSIYKGRPEAMFQLGQRYVDLGREEDAIEVYQAAIDAIESPRGREGADAETLVAWDAAVEGILFQLAQLYYTSERYAESADMYERILEANPSDMTALTNMGVALIAAGETERANEAFTRLRQQPDLTPRELYIIGVGLHDAGQMVEAAELFGQANARMPQDQQSLFMQAFSLYRAAEAGGDWAAVVPVSEKLLAIDTHSILARRFLSFALTSVGANQALPLEQRNAHNSRANEVYSGIATLPFDIDQLQLVTADGAAALGGLLKTGAGAPGSEARIRAHFYDGTGAPVGTGEATVTLPASGQTVQFQIDGSTTGDAVGARYEVVN